MPLIFFIKKMIINFSSLKKKNNSFLLPFFELPVKRGQLSCFYNKFFILSTPLLTLCTNLGISLLLLTGCQEEETALENASSSQEKYSAERVIAEALSYVREDYCESISETTIVDHTLTGMLKAADPYSSYLSPEEYSKLNTTTRGEFGGIGLEILPTEKGFKVISALNDTPAQKAKILSGEYIVKIDGEDVLKHDTRSAIQRLQGQPGSSVVLEILNEEANTKRDVLIERALISINSVVSYVEDHIGYIRISLFNEQTNAKIRQAIQEIKKHTILKGVIIDLRNNPGGILEVAVEACGYFLEKCVVVSTKGKSVDDDRDYRVKGPDRLRGVPLLVLINNGSASGAEIMAAALKEHKRAILMGNRTFGKGSVQTVFPLSNRGALKLTTAYFFSPKMNPIHTKGVEPDFKIDLNEKDTLFESFSDSQLRAAFDFFKGLNDSAS